MECFIISIIFAMNINSNVSDIDTIVVEDCKEGPRSSILYTDTEVELVEYFPETGLYTYVIK